MFVNNILDNYFKEFHVKSDGELTYQQLNIIFLKAIRDFIDEKISIDDLSEIGNRFYGFLLNNPEKYTGNGGVLAPIFDTASELSFNMRSRERLKSFVLLMEQLFDYYEKNKHLI